MTEKEHDLLREMCERLSRIEATLDVRLIACENDIKENKSDQKWARKSIISTFLGLVATILGLIAAYFIKK
jgi:hypothetical protein